MCHTFHWITRYISNVHSTPIMLVIIYIIKTFVRFGATSFSIVILRALITSKPAFTVFAKITKLGILETALDMNIVYTNTRSQLKAQPTVTTNNCPTEVITDIDCDVTIRTIFINLLNALPTVV